MADYSTLTYEQLWRIIFINPLSGPEADYVVTRVRAERDATGFGLPGLEEPLDYKKVRDYVASKSGDFNDKAAIAKIYRDGLSAGALPTMDPDAAKAKADALLPGGWVERAIRAAIQTFTSPETWKALSEINITNWTNWDSADWDRAKKSFLRFASDPQGPIKLFVDANAGLLPYLISFMTGLSVDSSVIRGMLDGSIDADDRIAMGKVVYSLLDTNLLEPKVQQGFLERNPGDGEVENMQRLFGALLRLEVGGVALEAVEPLVPKQVARFLKSLREAMENALNLDDAAEEIFQVPINTLIGRGLEAQYNRKFKPADLSATEALQARIADKITDSDLTKILDNAGYRDDIRQILRDNAAANLTESDINDLYQWNLWDRSQVKEAYKQRFFEEPDRELKTKLVELTRRQRLREKVFELYGNLYRDGVATKQEVTPFLENYGYDADEVEMWFQVQELERRQRKWMSNSEVQKALKAGRMTAAEARDYFVLQGMEPNDANRVIVEEVVQEAIAALPKAVRDECAEILKPQQILTQLLGELLQLTGLGGLADAKLRELVQCLIQKLGATPTP